MRWKEHDLQFRAFSTSPRSCLQAIPFVFNVSIEDLKSRRQRRCPVIKNCGCKYVKIEPGTPMLGVKYVRHIQGCRSHGTTIIALGLGYGSVCLWRIFTPEQFEAINRFATFFCYLPFAFDFTLIIVPFTMNYQFITANTISKLFTVTIVTAWAKCNSKGATAGPTRLSLSTLTNSFVVGVPLAKAMYGSWAVDLVVQLSVVQIDYMVDFVVVSALDQEGML